MTTVSPTRFLSANRNNLVRLYAWPSGVLVILIAMTVLRATQIPKFGGFEVRSLVAGSMVMALLAMSQTVVILSGGINMAVGSLLVCANCFSARFMLNAGIGTVIVVAIATLVGSVLVSMLMGWITSLSGIPDIITTLAISFVLNGVAFVFLSVPGGGIPTSAAGAIVGGFQNPIPGIAWLLGLLVLTWLPFRHSRWGLSVYALGSQPRAAFFSGLSHMRVKVISYGASGFYAGAAGVVATAISSGGSPSGSTSLTALLTSVAAAVLGGVALSGGSGGMFGPVFAAILLGLLPAIMLGFGWSPNYSQMAQGIILIVVVIAGSVIQMRGRRS